MLNNLVQAIVPLVEQENVVTQAPNVPVLQGKQPLTSSDLSSKYKQKAGKPTSSDGITTQLSPHHKIPQIKSPPPPVYHLTIDCRGGGGTIHPYTVGSCSNSTIMAGIFYRGGVGWYYDVYVEVVHME